MGKYQFNAAAVGGLAGLTLVPAADRLRLPPPDHCRLAVTLGPATSRPLRLAWPLLLRATGNRTARAAAARACALADVALFASAADDLWAGEALTVPAWVWSGPWPYPGTPNLVAMAECEAAAGVAAGRTMRRQFVGRPLAVRLIAHPLAAEEVARLPLDLVDVVVLEQSAAVPLWWATARVHAALERLGERGRISLLATARVADGGTLAKWLAVGADAMVVPAGPPAGGADPLAAAYGLAQRLQRLRRQLAAVCAGLRVSDVRRLRVRRLAAWAPEMASRAGVPLLDRIGDKAPAASLGEWTAGWVGEWRHGLAIWRRLARLLEAAE